LFLSPEVPSAFPRQPKDIGNQFGVEVLRVEADVGDSGEPDRVVASAVERFGSVDIMVNNAGRACAGGLMAASAIENHARRVAIRFSA
jgi:NADP-dependent 3-hydroxy acid dehydrogenase YdfG